MFENLPGGRRIAQGLCDLAEGHTTHASLLVLIGAPKLRSLGIDVPADPDPGTQYPEERLFLLLHAEDPENAHARYNALVRGELVSFENILATQVFPMTR